MKGTVSSALELSVTALTKVRASHSPSFSPDGSQLAFISNLSGMPQIWRVPSGGGWPTMVTDLGDPVRTVRWSPSGEWLACTVAPGGGMNHQLYIVRPDGSELRRLTPGGKDNNWAGPWSRDGTVLALSSNHERSEAMDTYLIDLPTGTFRLAARNPGIGYLTDISADGHLAVLFREVSRSDNNLFLLDFAGGREVLLTPHEGPGSFARGTLSPDGRTVYLSSNKDRDMTAFARVHLDKDGGPGPIEVMISREDAELEDFKITEDGTTGALIWNVAGNSELEFVELSTMTVRAGPSLPAEVVAGVVWSRDGRHLAISASGSAAPWDIWVYDRAGDRCWQVTHSPHAGVDLERLIRPSLVRFAAHDGLPLTGWVYRPPGHAHPGPTVLSFHGGPESQEVPSFNALYQALVGQGIAVFAPNVRGSAGFGKTFVNLDNGELRFNAIRDIKSCVDYLIEAKVAAPNRIGIMGPSYGGYMTLAGLVEYPDTFAAGADLYGVVNFETFFQHTEPWMAAISTVEYGDPRTQRDLLRKLSPIHRIERIRAPLLVLHGANDTNVPVVEAEQVVERLRAREVAVEYILFPDEGHGFQKLENRIKATVAIVRWFVRQLNGMNGD